jgi:NADH:ubiquinone oxidoreductase subunit 3 (subunit A)
LALPVSFAAVIALRRANTTEEFWMIFVGLILVSIIFVGILLNQWLQVRRLRGSFNIIFGQYEDSAFPKKLHAPIKTARRSISIQYSILRGTFIVFAVIALFPASAAVYVWVSKLPLSLIDACILLVKSFPK